MNGDQGPETLWYLLVLVLVGSAVISRRMSFRTVLSMLLIWTVIFGVIAALYTRRADLGRMLNPSAQEQQSSIETTNEQGSQKRSVRLSLASDNHYWADGEINGHSVRFLIDSGATITAISQETARAAGLTVDANQPGVIMQTANGRMIAQRSNISGLTVGPISINDLSVVVAPGFGDVNVLGMNFLSHLKSWRVENGEMILEQ